MNLEKGPVRSGMSSSPMLSGHYVHPRKPSSPLPVGTSLNTGTHSSNVHSSQRRLPSGKSTHDPANTVVSKLDRLKFQPPSPRSRARTGHGSSTGGGSTDRSSRPSTPTGASSSTPESRIKITSYNTKPLTVTATNGFQGSSGRLPSPTTTQRARSIGDLTNNITNINGTGQKQAAKYGRRSSTPDRNSSFNNVLGISDSSSISLPHGGSSSTDTSPVLSPINSTSFMESTKIVAPYSGRGNTNSNNSNVFPSPPPYNKQKASRKIMADIDTHRLLLNDKLPATVAAPSTTRGTASYSSTQLPSLDRQSMHTSASTSNSLRGSFTLRTDQGLSGLRNLGNTCYMNSILQCLSASDSLTCVLLEKEHEMLGKAKKNGVVQGFIDLLKQMWLNERNGMAIAPTLFKQRIQRLAPQFQGYDQHDSQEFLRFLLSGLHDELNKVVPKSSSKWRDSSSPVVSSIDDELAERAWKRSLMFDNSEISAIFMGQLKSTLVCKTCEHTSVTFDPFWDLSLSIPKVPSAKTSYHHYSSSSSAYNILGTTPSTVSSSSSMYGSGSGGVSLEDCFTLFTAKEKLDNDNKPYCEKCESLQPGTKQLSIQRFPDVLVLHLKRFSGLHYRTKLSTFVKFDEHLKLPMKEEGVPVRYQLYAVSNHSGSCYGGHYTAYCKHPVQERWYHFNDSSVAPVSSSSISSPQAYVLFYKRVKSFNSQV